MILAAVKRLGGLTVLAALAVGLASAPGASAASSCIASAVRVDLLGARFEPFVANPGSTPCIETSVGATGTTLAVPIPVSGPVASTYPATSFNGQPGARAYAGVGNARIPILPPGMTVSGLESSAVATCRAGVPSFGSTSNTSRVHSDAERPIELPDEGVPKTIPLATGGTLVINEKIQTATRITRRALRLDTPFLDIVFAESSAGIDSCPPARPSARKLRRVSRMR